MAYTVEKDFEHAGLRCVVIFSDKGHRCGYVGVRKDHTLYSLRYSDPIPEVLKNKWEKIKEGPIGKRGAIDLLCMACHPDIVRVGYLFDVHGGITYSGNGVGGYPVESNLWFFGFDCDHSGDGKDYEGLKKYNYNKPVYGGLGLDAVVRTEEYVVEECKNLADQLSSI